MLITLLGTGTSGGVPMLTCPCEVCQSLDFRDKRLRVSVHIETGGKSFVIDTGPDFRQQMLQERIKTIDAILFTHEHKDHTAGLDDIRPYNYLNGTKTIPIYARDWVLEQIQQEFAYAFASTKYPGIPLIELHSIENKTFSIQGVAFTPIEAMHHLLPVFGFRIGDFTYLTDVKSVAEEEIEKIRGSKVLVLGALQQAPHISHFTLQEAIEFVEKVQPEKTYLTHISHRMGRHADVEKNLPEHIRLGYDGLRIQL